MRVDTNGFELVYAQELKTDELVYKMYIMNSNTLNTSAKTSDFCKRSLSLFRRDTTRSRSFSGSCRVAETQQGAPAIAKSLDIEMVQ